MEIHAAFHFSLGAGRVDVNDMALEGASIPHQIALSLSPLPLRDYSALRGHADPTIPFHSAF